MLAMLRARVSFFSIFYTISKGSWTRSTNIFAMACLKYLHKYIKYKKIISEDDDDDIVYGWINPLFFHHQNHFILTSSPPYTPTRHHKFVLILIKQNFLESRQFSFITQVKFMLFLWWNVTNSLILLLVGLSQN